MSSFALTEKRNKIVDYPYAGLSPMAVMIPKPTAQKMNRLSAVGQPFEPIVSILNYNTLTIRLICVHINIEF